jgi:hypothetical protein
MFLFFYFVKLKICHILTIQIFVKSASFGCYFEPNYFGEGIDIKEKVKF